MVVIAHTDNGRKVGLVVEELIGQQQVVIKSLTDSLRQIRGVSGAAILGDGRVGLILEPTGLLKVHSDSRTEATIGVSPRVPARAGLPRAADADALDDAQACVEEAVVGVQQ